jgi:hypothetical protein
VTPTIYAVPTEKTSPRFAQAFASGCGGEIVTDDRLRDGSVAMFGSPARWDVLQQAFRLGRAVFYGDHGYFGRARYFRITVNGYQHDGRGPARSQRFDTFQRPVQPWRKTGSHILICPNSATHFRLFGLDVDAWMHDCLTTLRAHSDRPIRQRWKGDPVPITDDLKDCWAVVTYSSAAALDALIAGVPVFVLADFAAAYRFGSPGLSRIESPEYPTGREPFLWNLAANQWTLDEIRRGDAWRALSVDAAQRVAS